MKYLRTFLAFLALLGCLSGCAPSEAAQSGNATTCTENTTDTQAINKDPILEPPHTEVPFGAQYIRTDGYAEDAAFPVVRVIHSIKDLQDYYTQQKDRFDLERRETYGTDYTIGFLDACDKYADSYFEKNYLILVALQEPSGSNRHEIRQVIVDFGEQDTEIWLDRIVPEVGTDDMAQWHLFVELERHGVTKTQAEVEVYINGKLAYTGSKIVPPEIQPDFTEPPAGTLATPTGEIALSPAGYHWLYKLPNGTEATAIADQAGRPLSRSSVYPVLLEKDLAENTLGYPVKLWWESAPTSVKCTVWPDAVWEQEGVEEETVPFDLGDMFYAREGGHIYEFSATWEDGGDYHGTANYYVYIIGGADHTHQTAIQPQTVDDPYVGYCGNTWTTLRLLNGQEYAFMYGYSVTLTDILLNLNYDPMKVCRCLPQYTVDTEFGTGYGINLSQGYARCEKGQADLTQEQIDTIRKIINWAVKTNCAYPIEN